MKLLIVESPNKVKTISQFLPKDYVVKASVGHITEIKDSGLYNLGIDPKTFEADFQISSGKKDIVKELKELVKKADIVYLASDPDREGESIAWHLKEQLKIPAKKLKRITYHEITKKAVEDAINNPRKIDQELVDAALSRAKLDKIVGYRLSPISRRAISAKSVGRCQSAALKLVVDREREILAFDSKKYYEIYLPFKKNKLEYTAQYKGLLKDKKNSPTIEDKKEAEKIIKNCDGKEFTLKSIQSNDRKISPKPPFITSTLQQEASSRFGYSIKKTQECAQRLFEGINIGGKHVALITYIRTDDTSISPEFVEEAKSYITKLYGKSYYVGPREKKKKVKNEQGGHECIRPVDLSITPEVLSSYVNDSQLLKIYTLIYNRTLASLMPECIITDTDFTISEGKYKFIYTEHAMKYDGFRKVYSVDDEELTSALDLFTGDKINNKKLELKEKTTQPPKRYSEATLVKELEKAGVGRP